MANIPQPSMPQRRGFFTRKRVIIAGVLALVALLFVLYEAAKPRWDISPYQAEVLSDVFNNYDWAQQVTLCANIDRPNESTALAQLSLHYVQEVERRGDDIAEAGVPEEDALKDATVPVCEDAFGDYKWWRERETRPEGPIPYTDFLE